MKSTFSGQRDPILYSLGRIAFLREHLKKKESLEEKLQLIDTIQHEVISSLYAPADHIKHESVKYNLDEKIDPIESKLRGMELTLTGKTITIAQKRAKLLDSFVFLKAEVRKMYM